MKSYHFAGGRDDSSCFSHEAIWVNYYNQREKNTYCSVLIMTYLSFVWYLATQRVSLKQYMEWIKKADKICILCCLICWVLCGFRETGAVSQTLPGIANMNAVISQSTAIYYWSWNIKNVQPPYIASLYSWEINSLSLLISIVFV